MPPVPHWDTGQICNYSSWFTRGWCRTELWCKMMLGNQDCQVSGVFWLFCTFFNSFLEFSLRFVCFAGDFVRLLASSKGLLHRDNENFQTKHQGKHKQLEGFRSMKTRLGLFDGLSNTLILWQKFLECLGILVHGLVIRFLVLSQHPRDKKKP